MANSICIHVRLIQLILVVLLLIRLLADDRSSVEVVVAQHSSQQPAQYPLYSALRLREAGFDRLRSLIGKIEQHHHLTTYCSYAISVFILVYNSTSLCCEAICISNWSPTPKLKQSNFSLDVAPIARRIPGSANMRPALMFKP